MARKAKRKDKSLDDMIELAGTAFPAGTQLKPCICGHGSRQHEMLIEEVSKAEWYMNCKICDCFAFRQMDNLAYVKWVYEHK